MHFKPAVQYSENINSTSLHYTCREEDSSSYETVTDSESDTAPDKQEETKAR